MHTDTRFGGLAGLVMGGFLRPRIFLTALPMAAVWIVLALAVGASGLDRSQPGLVQLLAALLAILFVARFALPAANGEFDEGLFSRYTSWLDALSYTLRYGLVVLAWSVPCGGLIYGGIALAQRADLDLNLAMLGPVGMVAGFGFAVLLIALGAVVWLLILHLAFIMAAAVTSLRELFNPYTWSDHLLARRGDLIPFFGSFVGGILLFYALYLLPMLLLNILSFRISMETGFAVTLLVYTLPVLISPILMGRLAGAFVFGGLQPLREAELDAVAPPPVVDPTPPPRVAAAPAPIVNPAVRLLAKPSLEELAAKVAALPPEQADAARQQAQAALARTPPDPRAAFELALLTHRFGPAADGPLNAARAITLCLDNALPEMALQVYRLYRNQSATLPLDAGAQLNLGQLLARHGAFLDGGWFMHNGLHNNGDPTGAQKRLIEVANQASAAGRHEIAVKLLEFLLSKHPNSQFKEYVAGALESARRQL